MLTRAHPLLFAFLLPVACGRYGDFRLPVAAPEPAAGEWTWEPRPAPVIPYGPRGAWDSVDTLNPSVVRRGNTYFNFYSGFDGKLWHTGLATSPDGIEWTRRGRGLSPPDDGYIAANGSALFDGREFLYWYQSGSEPRMELARSPDGIQWTRHPQPVLRGGPRGSWDERGIADPYVVRYGGWYYCYYLGQDRARRQRLGVARSQDGVVWTRLRTNPVLEIGEDGTFDENGLGEPAVWHAHGSYWMLYTGRDRREVRRMGLARSPDGVRWTRVPSPVIAGDQPWNAQVVCDATVEVVPEGVRVWFGGGDLARPDERLHGQIGYGLLRWQPR